MGLGLSMNNKQNENSIHLVQRPTKEKYLEFFVECFRNEYSPLLLDKTDQMLRDLKTEQLDTILPGENQKMLEAFEPNGRTIGTVVFSEVGNDVYVWGLYVLPFLQRRGLGQSLMQQVCEQTRPGTTLEVQVLKQSLKAQRFYKKLGFHTHNTSEEEVFPSINLEVDFMSRKRDLLFDQLAQH
jgi:ribosomal protein S18 acetylase RimI-like enzyme